MQRLRGGGRGDGPVTRMRWLPAAATILVAVAAVAGATVTSSAKPASAAAQPAAVNTARVQRRTLSAMVSEPGTLTYRARSDDSPYSVINRTGGTYTELPVAGDVVAQGHVLYRVNDRAVVLLHGTTPAYRTLKAGARGPDVAELNTDLVALGYATRVELNPKAASFEPATTTAVEKLQAALGMTQTGKLKLGRAVFEPSTVRVTSVSAEPGGSARPGETVLQGTSTSREVQVALSSSQQTSVAVGDSVSITLPTNRAIGGVVSAVGAVATCPSSSGSGGSDSGSAAPGADACSSASSASGSTPTIAVDVTPSRRAATGRWDQAPVQVGITTARVRGAVVVPVTALLARASGGYAVEVVTAATSHLVPVSVQRHARGAVVDPQSMRRPSGLRLYCR